MASEFLGSGPLSTGSVEQQLAELREIVHRQSVKLQELRAAFFQITYVVPERPRSGMIRYADGTEWNPGAGEGYYQYSGGAWSAL